MKKLLLLLSVVIAGCGGGSPANTTPSQPIQPVVHIFNSSIKPSDVNVSCFTSRALAVDLSVSNEYFVENNTWGSSAISASYKWSQCIGSTFKDPNTLVAKWTWDMGYDLNSGVKSYPEIIYGVRPGSNYSSNSFPKIINNVKNILIKWDIEIDKNDSSGQLLLESWISSTFNPTSIKDKNMVAEMGIILDCWGATNGWCNPNGEKVNIGGYDYIFNVNPAPNPGNPKFITFNSITPQLVKSSIDLGLFLTFLKSRGVITDQQYIDDVEFGTEIVFGKGEVRLNSYSVTIN